MAITTQEKPNYRRAKIAALDIIREFGITDPPVDPVYIARQKGVNVHFVGFSDDFRGVSGFYDPEENAIYVNKDELPLRQTFTVAHELGHKILHEEWANSLDYKVLMRDSEGNDDPIEREANVFAANLLVPRLFLDKYQDILSIRDLSRIFAVSVPAIQNRLNFEYGT